MSGEKATRYVAIVLVVLLAGTQVMGGLPLSALGTARNASSGSPHNRTPTPETAGTVCKPRADVYAMTPDSVESPGSPEPADSGGGLAASVADIATARIHYDVWFRIVGRNTTTYQDSFTAKTEATVSAIQVLSDPGLDTDWFESVGPVAVDIHRELTEGSTKITPTTRPELEIVVHTTDDSGTITMTVEGPNGMRAVMWNSLAVRRQCDG